MISSWLTQARTCWSLACGPTEAPVTTRESYQSDQHSRTNDDDSIGNNNRSKSYGIGKVLSTLTNSTATSFSSWTESCLPNSNTSSRSNKNDKDGTEDNNHQRNQDIPIMVLRQLESNGGSIPQHFIKPSKNASAMISHKQGFSGEIATGLRNDSPFTKKVKNKKNELLYPISPYDEIPTIRDLFDQLSPHPGLSSLGRGQQEEFRQERQDLPSRYKHGRKQEGGKKMGHPETHHQKSDRTPVPVSRNRNDAHDVPVIIEMPTTPTYSEDSELSLDECLKQYDEDERDQRSLTPHPSFQEGNINEQPTAVDVHHIFHASIKAEQELVWPSDEDDLSAKKKMIVSKNRDNPKSKARHRHRVRLV
eukprot:jgi/Psemu1/252935/estExt_Genewise1Plus.C_580090